MEMVHLSAYDSSNTANAHCQSKHASWRYAKYLNLFGMVALVLIALVQNAANVIATTDTNSFTMVALPDTQKYVKYNVSETQASTFKQQTQ